MSGSSLVKQIAMTIVADDGDAHAKLADITAKADQLARPRSLTIAADTGEAKGEVDAVSEALAKYKEAVSSAAEASAKLAEVQGESSSSAADVQAAADKNTEAVLRERQAWLSLGEAQTTAAAKARETAAAQQESAAKVGAGGEAAAASSGKLHMLAIGLAGAAAGSVDLAIKFQEASTTLVTGAGESEQALDMVKAGMLQISTQTATSSQQVVAGMYMIESAGYHGAAGLKVLQAAAEGAKVGNADLGTVADATTTVLTDYKMKASEAGEAVGGLVTIVSAGKVHMEDLAASLSKVLPTAAALHVSFAQVGGAMATMTGEGISAKLAAMGLNSTMISIAAPTKGAAKEMEALGLTSTQVASTLTHQGLVAALQEVTDAAAKKFPPGSAAYVDALNKMLGGHRGLQVALALTGSHLKDLEKNTKDVGKATHDGSALTEAFGKVQKDAAFKLEQAKIATENAGTSIGSVLLPAINKVMTPIDGFITGLTASKTKAEILTGVLVGGLAIYATTKVIGAFKAVSGAVHDVTSGISGLIGKITGAGTAAEAQAVKTEAMTVATEAQTVATEEAAVAQEGLDVAMDANPIGLIILGVTLLVGGIILLVTHLKDAKHWAEDAFHFIEHAAEDAWNWVKGHWPLLLAILTGPIGLAVLFIKDHWKTIKHDAEVVVHDVAGFFARLPGMIIHGLEDLDKMMEQAGIHAIESLIRGILSMAGAVGNAVASIAHKVAGFFGLSPAVEGPLSGGGAPEIRGAHFTAALAAGMLGGTGDVIGASHQLAQATLAGYTGGSSRPVPGAGGGGYREGDIYLTVHGFVGNEQQLALQIQTSLRSLKRRNGNAPLGLS